MSEKKTETTDLSGLEHHKVGITRGCWYMLHIMAEAAITRPLMEAYAFNFRNLCHQMTGCSCKGDCIMLLEKLPPEKYFDMVDEFGIPNGCLYHSILIHNNVNAKLGKRTYSYEEAAKIYRKTDIRRCNDGVVKEAPDINRSLASMEASRVKIYKIEELAKLYPELIIKMNKT